ncbi:hypothetical protein D3C76_1666740 [compost metagenome]
MPWIIEDFFYRSGLYDLTSIHDRYTIRHIRYNTEIMCYKNNGRSYFSLQFLHQF